MIVGKSNYTVDEKIKHNRVASWIAAGITAAMLLGSAYFAYGTMKFLSGAQIAIGEVTAMRLGSSTNSSGVKNYYYRADMTFIDSDGVTQFAKLGTTDGAVFNSYRGLEVEILYNKEFPEFVRVNQNKIIWMQSLFAGGFALIAALFALLFWWKSRKIAKSAAPLKNQ